MQHIHTEAESLQFLLAVIALRHTACGSKTPPLRVIRAGGMTRIFSLVALHLDFRLLIPHVNQILIVANPSSHVYRTSIPRL
jgi:hypothetical protein